MAAGIGGNGTEIEWDRVNSEYRYAFQEAVVVILEHEEKIAVLENEKREQDIKIETLQSQLANVLKRLDKLEKAKSK